MPKESEDYAREVGERLRDVRKALSIRQVDLAKALDLTKNTIYLYEKGKRSLPIEALAKLCKAYRVDPKWILAGVGPMFLKEELLGSPPKPAKQKVHPHLILEKEDPELHRLVAMLKESKPKEKSRFMKMAIAYFEGEKKKL